MTQIRGSMFYAQGRGIRRGRRPSAEAPGSPEGSGGFTLIELLVVVAILAVLLAILLPTISKVRTAGYDSATTHRMQALMTAIDNYYQANNAYPGPLGDNEIYSSTNTSPKAINNTNAGTLPAGVTSTENLTLGLLGGAVPITPASGGLQINYEPTRVTTGPQVLNQLQSRQYGPYADPKACGLETQVGGSWVKWSDPSHPTVTHQSIFGDTVIPEFTDSFPDAMPILYMRAGGSAATNISIPGAPDASTGKVDSTGKLPVVWNPSQLQPYVFPAVAQGASGTVAIVNDAYSGTPDAAVLADFPGGSDARQPHYYFTAADHVTPRQKGGYLLIVAGKDRKYMTKDDRINGSPVQ